MQAVADGNADGNADRNEVQQQWSSIVNLTKAALLASRFGFPGTCHPDIKGLRQQRHVDAFDKTTTRLQVGARMPYCDNNSCRCAEERQPCPISVCTAGKLVEQLDSPSPSLHFHHAL